MNVPTALASAEAAAKSVAAVAQAHRSRCDPTEADFCGVGRKQRCGYAASSKQPAFPITRPSPTRSAASCILVRYREALEALMATPPSLPQDFKPDVAAARAVVEGAVRDGRTWLDPIEVTRLLAAYSIPIVPALLARDCRRSRRRRGPAAGRGIDRRGEDPVARHRSQIRRRRRAAEPDQRTRRARGGRRYSRARQDGKTRRSHQRRHDPSHGPASQGARADRRDCRRSDLRARRRIRPRRDCGRGHRRQGAGASAARSRSRSRVDRAHPRVARAQGLPRRAGRGRERDCARCWSSSRSSLPICPRCESSISTPLLADQNGLIAVDARVAVAPVDQARRGPRPSPLRDPALSQGMGETVPRCATERGFSSARCGRKTSRCMGRSSLRSRRRTCGCVSSRR